MATRVSNVLIPHVLVKTDGRKKHYVAGHTHCERCGSRLSDARSALMGFGPDCRLAMFHAQEQNKNLRRSAMHKRLNERAREYGELKLTKVAYF